MLQFFKTELNILRCERTKCKPAQRPHRHHQRMNQPKRKAFLAHVLPARKVVQDGEQSECRRPESHREAVDVQAAPAAKKVRGGEHEEEHEQGAEGEGNSDVGFAGS